MVIRCSKADLVDNFCEVLKEFEERANNRICQRHYLELKQATRELLKANGMLVEVQKADTLDWEDDDDSDDDTDEDDLLEIVSQDSFEYGYDGMHSGGIGVRDA